MDKKNIEELKQKLEKEKIALEEQLKKFATKDENMKGDWDTRFPKLDSNVSGSAGLEAAADEVEEYSTLLPQEHSMEIKIQNINLALEKMKNGKYGVCESCQKEIPLDRLNISPESRFCFDCGNNK
ncbi:MAG: TraR/DksA family transcriptional regulator [Parcubacteria group bacterium]